jgi:putative MATE family efflux protein
VPLLTDDPAVVGNCTAYFSIRMLEALPIMLLGCGRGFFDGIGHTQIYMRVMIFANCCNILLNWLLIFGHWGFPRMEVAGAAVASAISMYLGTALMAVIASARRYRGGYGILRFGGWTWSTLQSVVRLSAPASCRILLILAGFTLFLTLIGKVGTAELAASHLVINISSLSWMPGFGMGIAVTTIVGQKLGASDPRGAREFSWEGVRLSWSMMAALGAVFLIMPEPVIRIFTNDPTVIAYAKPALRMLGLSQFIDPFNIVLEGALMGAGKMVYIMFLEVGIVWLVMLPATWYLLMVQGTGYLGAWAAFLLYIILLAAAIVRKFLQKEWETTKV